MKKLLLLFILIPYIGLSQIQIGQDIYGNFAQDLCGSTVSLSANGMVLAVGSSGSNSEASLVKVFNYENSNWVQLGQDINGVNSGDTVGGFELSLSSDGTVVAIGTSGNSDNGQNSGKVKVYKIISGIWTQLGQDLVGELPGSLFGRSVSLSMDGTIIAIGAPSTQTNWGYIRILKYEEPTGWTQIGMLIPGAQIGDLFGTSVSLSADGSTVAVGSYFNDFNGIVSGLISVFYKPEDTLGFWVQLGDAISGDAPLDYFGVSVSLSSDGNILAAGALSNDANSLNFGYVKVFIYENDNWIQIGDDIDGEASGDYAGLKVSLSSDGSIIAIGSLYDNTNAYNGYTRLFKIQSDIWSKIGNNIGGNVVSLSSTGTKLSIGDYRYDGTNGSNSGRVQVFSFASELGLLEVVEDIAGNNNGINVTAEQLNAIDGVSGAIDGVNYTTALDNGTFVDENNPTASEIQAIIDLVNATLGGVNVTTLEFQLYPNPAKTKFTIQLNNSLELKNVNIYNNLGQNVLTTKNTVVDISKLASGLYIVEIETISGKTSKKLIIE